MGSSADGLLSFPYPALSLLGCPALGTWAPMIMPSGPNQRWSLDFVSDALTDGRLFRILCIVDD